jgi:glycosyltransferase involved in cell wall biosynthesis
VAAHRGLLPWLLPLVAAQRYGGKGVRRQLAPLMLAAADRLIAIKLEACDVFIGMSGLCIESARAARNRYGAKVFIERGSRHVLSQQAILDELRDRGLPSETVTSQYIERELAGYSLADQVAIPSLHVAQSFLEQGFPVSKLFRNPYGVDLDMFMPTVAPANEPPRAIYTGAWSYRKGCGLLVEAVARLDGAVQLLHVGAVADAPLPLQSWFQHQDAVAQWQLPTWYGRAQVFVLASREEGLSLVQAQALACGLPVVCTDRTGGDDLAELTGLKEGIFVVPHDDPDALVNGIRQAVDWAQSRFPVGVARNLLGEARSRLSWRAYGERYSSKLAAMRSR